MLSFQMSLAAMAITSIGLVTPRLTEDFLLSVSQQGMLVSIQFTGAAIACLLSGIFCEKYGSAFITRVSLLIGFVALTGFAFIQSYPMALIGVFLIGAVVLSLENSLMSSALSIEGRGHLANSILQASFSVGAILVPLLFLLFGIWQQWRPVYFTLAALTLPALIVSRGSLNKSESPGLVRSLKGYLRYFTKPRFMLGAVVLFLYVAAEVGLWSLTPTLFESTGGGRLAGIISSCLIWVMMLGGRLLGTVLMRRFNMIRILIPFGMLGILSYTLLIFTSGPAAIVFAALAGLSCAPFYAFVTSWSTVVANDKSSSYLAFVMAFGSFGPVFLGWIVSLLGNTVAGKLIILPALCCFAVMMLLLFLFGLRSEEDLAV